MVMALEDGFGIDVADIEIDNIETVGDLYAAILNSLWRADSTARSPKPGLP
jgi:acyl carrier protein